MFILPEVLKILNGHEINELEDMTSPYRKGRVDWMLESYISSRGPLMNGQLLADCVHSSSII